MYYITWIFLTITLMQEFLCPLQGSQLRNCHGGPHRAVCKSQNLNPSLPVWHSVCKQGKCSFKQGNTRFSVPEQQMKIKNLANPV